MGNDPAGNYWICLGCFLMIKSKMFEYIRETPEVLKKILKERSEISREFVQFYKDKEINQIYILGSGTSYHAGLAAKNFLEEILNRKVFVMYPTQFERGEKVFNFNTLVVGVSQGGQSLSTVVGLKSAKDRGLYTAAVSENPAALIFDAALTKTEIKVGNEKCGAKTKGYAGTILTLMLMFTELALAKQWINAAQAETYFLRMHKVYENINSIIDASVLWYLRIKEEILPARRIIVVGYNGVYADVLEGALKILETVRQGVTGYDIEEFFHGIYNSVNEDTYLFYLASEGDYKQRTLRLIEILSQWTDHHYLIGSSQGVNVENNRYLLCDFVEDPLFSVWEYIIPLQIVACFTAQDLGINPDIPKDPEFHKKIGSKILDGVRDAYKLEK